MDLSFGWFFVWVDMGDIGREGWGMGDGAVWVFDGILDEGIDGKAFFGEGVVGDFVGQGLRGEIQWDIGVEGDAFRGPFEWREGFSVGEGDAVEVGTLGRIGPRHEGELMIQGVGRGIFAAQIEGDFVGGGNLGLGGFGVADIKRTERIRTWIGIWAVEQGCWVWVVGRSCRGVGVIAEEGFPSGLAGLVVPLPKAVEL